MDYKVSCLHTHLVWFAVSFIYEHQFSQCFTIKIKHRHERDTRGKLNCTCHPQPWIEFLHPSKQPLCSYWLTILSVCYIFELPKYSLWVLKHFGKNCHNWKEDSAWKTLWCQVYKMKHKRGVMERVAGAPSPRRSWCLHQEKAGPRRPRSGSQARGGRGAGPCPACGPHPIFQLLCLGHPWARGPVSLSACQPLQTRPEHWARCSRTSGLSLEPLCKPQGGLCLPAPAPPVRAPCGGRIRVSQTARLVAQHLPVANNLRTELTECRLFSRSPLITANWHLSASPLYVPHPGQVALKLGQQSHFDSFLMWTKLSS